MQTGYLMLQRRFFSHWLWEEKRSLSKAEAFLDLLQLAAFAPTKRMISGALIELDEGEVAASIRYLSARWMWGKDKVAGFMKILESDGIIRRQTRQGETVVTLCNYKDYNGASDSKPDSKQDTRQTVIRQRPDKIEEGKEGKELSSTFAQDGASPDPAPKESIQWAEASGFIGISESQINRWKSAYPAVNIERNIAAASEWLASNPTKRKKLHGRFLNNWLSRAQEKGGDVARDGYRAQQPSFEDVQAYCLETEQPAERAGTFFDHCAKNGWRDRSGPITDWKAAFRLHCHYQDKFQTK